MTLQKCAKFACANTSSTLTPSINYTSPVLVSLAILPRRLPSASITQQYTMKCLPCVYKVNLRENFWILLTDSRGGSKIFFRTGCTRLLRYFNTNKPHSFFFFFLQNTSCIRKRSSQGGGGCAPPCTLPLDPPLDSREKRWLVLLLSSPRAVRVMACADHSLQIFLQKYFFGKLIVLRHLSMDFTILRVINLSQLSLSFRIKT